MMGKRRMEENTMKLLHHYVEDSSRLQIAAQSEISIPQRRRAAQALRLATEAQIKGIQDERALAAKRHELEVHQSQALAGELERRQAERERREREVQRICGESEELKELELKLKVAYMNKERAAQHEERILQQRRHQLREHAIDDQMESSSTRAPRESELFRLKAEKKARDKAAFERIVAETEKHRAEEEELQALRDLLSSARSSARRSSAVEAMRHKFAEDERNERLIADRRAADKAKYIEAVKLQKIERQEVYERAKAAEMEENGNALKSEEYRLRVVQEARRRLLLEHADELQGFLPKGTIQPEDDFFFAKTQAA
ncbi:N-acetylneuraminate 7-O(or 9-O)-acetyltransferase [Aureococcus anophagefferens]|nr:N-acetylneuraminate 7-O(or 9-O)-acetyltransferase [Aureococcus anophagefferens]